MILARYSTDLTDTQWAFLAPLIPAAKVGGRPRSTDMREVVNAVFYVLRGGCQWRLLPKDSFQGLRPIPARMAWRSRCAHWESWNGLSLRSNGCRTPSCVVVATSAS